jgi:hypothetical protein
MTTTTLATSSVADILDRAARHVAQPINASLPEALRTATRDPHLAEQAVQQLADTLKLHPRDLPLWDVTRPRNHVAKILRIAAGVVAR